MTNVVTGSESDLLVRPSVPAMDEILGRRWKVLDHGFVRVIDYMGDDAAVVQAARVSYGKGTKSVREDASLIRYLMRNEHTSPFEMASLKLHVKLPIFVARQWIRHRTASVNEISARYSEMKDEFYVPEVWRLQGGKSGGNRQGSEGEANDWTNRDFRARLMTACRRNYELYEAMLGEDFAREMARMALPVNLYSEWYWKMDLKNLLHFLDLRLDSHAQWEIQQYGKVIAEIMARWLPEVTAAWVESGGGQGNG